MAQVPQHPTARRWTAHSFGKPDVLQLEEFIAPPPEAGQVTIDVRAVGMNPTDFKAVSGMYTKDPSLLPLVPGAEVAGVIAAMGPGTEIASGGGAVGDEVLAYRITGGYSTQVTVSADDVYAKPASVGFAEAANLLLAGATAADMMRVTSVTAGQTALVHGASGAVGVSLLQQLRSLGVRTIGTSSEKNFAVVERFGGEPVVYGAGLEQRVRQLAPNGIDVAFDTVGTDEAVDVSLALVADRDHVASAAAMRRAPIDGFHVVGGTAPGSAEFRKVVRARLIALAASGELVVPIAQVFPFADAVEALTLLATGHPGGKLALEV
ncbi:MAG: NADPH:quinone reductase [Microbacteriaceae bacterium]|nr:NADPH:quinone reductase [Microbacteriaceae bacterium]